MGSIRHQFKSALVNLLPVSDPVDLSGRHVFLTGGTGLLGKSLLDYFSESATNHGENFRVTVMSRSPDDFLGRWPKYRNACWLQVKRGDLKAFPRLDRSVTDFVHAAGETHSGMDKILWTEQIIGGTASALDWAESAGARRFLLTSSGAVYGPQPPTINRLVETFNGGPPPTDISSVYGQAKRVAEQLCTVFSSSRCLQTIIARCFSIVCPYLLFEGPYAVGNFIRDALTRDAIRVRGDGTPVRTYLFGRDVAHWLTTLLVRGSNGEAYNVGSDQPINMTDLAGLVASVVSPGKPVVIENAVPDDASRSIYVPDISKAGGLGLKVETALQDAIRLSAGIHPGVSQTGDIPNSIERDRR
jgi:nucleoside-diphosphate-sugar epimerase